MRRMVIAALLSSQVFAAEPVASVPVQVIVVQASTRAGEVPASLKKMQTALGARVKYGSMKVISTTQVQLTGSGERVELPNQKHAQFSLEKLKDGVATVQVQVAPTKATYTLAKDKSLYFQAGAVDGDDLWLVLSQPKQ
jgi:hypothetical protein